MATTVTITASFAAVDGTPATGGETLYSGYVSLAANGQSRLEIPLQGLTAADVPLTLDSAGANPTPLSIVCTATSGTMNCFGSVSWQETY